MRHVVDKALSKMPLQDGQRIRHELDKLTENAERREVDIDTLTGRSGCPAAGGRHANHLGARR